MSSLFRFYNRTAGGHFFTSDVAERDAVTASLPNFAPEGVAFDTVAPTDAGAVNVYRFYNLQAGGHFFTSDLAERDSVMANLPNFRFEGVGFNAAAAPGTGLEAVYRFYNLQAGGHFFTSDIAERDSVVANIPTMRFEGIAFYEHRVGYVAPPVVVKPPAETSSDGVRHDGDAYFTAPTSSLMVGTSRDEAFFGGGGNDTIKAGAGNDYIFAGGGSDVLTGGPGNDTFMFRAGDGRDVITDYQQGDHLLFRNISPDFVGILAAHGPPNNPGEMSSFAGYDVVYGNGGPLQGSFHLDGITYADLAWVQASFQYEMV